VDKTLKVTHLISLHAIQSNIIQIIQLLLQEISSKGINQQMPVSDKVSSSDFGSSHHLVKWFMRTSSLITKRLCVSPIIKSQSRCFCPTKVSPLLRSVSQSQRSQAGTLLPTFTSAAYSHKRDSIQQLPLTMELKKDMTPKVFITILTIRLIFTSKVLKRIAPLHK
jgi:hypothetical protein